MSHYARTISQLVAQGRLDPKQSTLVVAGGPKDRQVLLDAGFTDVTISNLDTRMIGNEFAPYSWRLLDGENLDVADGAFAQVIEHLGLHHCGSPHRGLLEMYRCASDAVLVFENRDSFSLRLAVALGLVRDYEHDAVAGNDYVFGGWRNTGVPNAVYRWTEREVAKTLASADPAHQVPLRFFYGLRLPSERIEALRSPVLRMAVKIALLPFRLLAAIVPKQMNEFAFFIDKRARTLQPWIDPETGTLSRLYWEKLSQR